MYLSFPKCPSNFFSFKRNKNITFQAGIRNEISQRLQNGYKKATEVAKILGNKLLFMKTKNSIFDAGRLFLSILSNVHFTKLAESLGIIRISESICGTAFWYFVQGIHWSSLYHLFCIDINVKDTLRVIK